MPMKLSQEKQRKEDLELSVRNPFKCPDWRRTSRGQGEMEGDRNSYQEEGTEDRYDGQCRRSPRSKAHGLLTFFC